MKTKLFLPLLSGALLISSVARADVYWQHNATVSIAGRDLVSAQFHNAWSGDNHKATLKVDASRLSQLGSGMPLKGEFSLIERLGDDKIIGVFPAQNIYIEESYSTLKPRLRFDLWKGLDDSLGTEPIPELTPEQRRRLGRELRASLGVVINPFVKTYFRPLPNKRVINGMESRGYRLTTRVNLEPGQKGGQWMTASGEWWIAQILPEDAEILSFTRRANALKKAGGPATQSMWSNETYAILWQAAPVPLQEAFRTLVGQEGAVDYGFQGTPMQMFFTVSPPPMQKAMWGDLRVKVELAQRKTESFPTSAFQTPTNLKRQEIEPFLKSAQILIDQSRRYIKEAFKEKQ